jgi:hypothetical protein
MSRNECLLEERMGSGLDIGQMLQKKQMASPFLRNGDTETRRKGETGASQMNRLPLILFETFGSKF